MIESIISGLAVNAISKLYGRETEVSLVTVQKTRPDFEGDFTLVVFPLTRFSGKSPDITAREIGEFITGESGWIRSFNVVKGFLNLVVEPSYWMDFLSGNLDSESFGFKDPDENRKSVIEFSSPNTNKPLHLGHIRNNLLGWSLARILEANGHTVFKVNLVNDRGIHICKTMLAYRLWHQGETPAQAGMKGDKYVGKLYVEFEKANRAEIEKLTSTGLSDEEAFRRSPLTLQAMELLNLWEAGDSDTRALWSAMNGWVYEGFEHTYNKLGINFDKIYYESDTYLLGKELVAEGLSRGVFTRRDDGSVWADLSSYKLDEKLLLRSDGTSVYITQDLGTAQLRHDEFHADRLFYVVGNEQIYHFDVLKALMHMLGRDWWDKIVHVSYGMVELPQGKMKSREGTVVDADDLMEEMYETAKSTTAELGKLDNPDDESWRDLFTMIGMGALKYFILKVDPKKNMLFNPAESIDFNGNTGPFIQYTHARIRSLISRGEERGFKPGINFAGNDPDLHPKEKQVIRMLYDFPGVVEEAGRNLSPAMIANYCYELAREYNQFYQDVPVLRETDEARIRFRLALSGFTASVLRRGMGLLGIEVPERM